MALKFLNKKGWHTGSLRNIENVWKAEQKHEAEQKKLEELRKQIQDERERSEFRLLQEQAGLVPRQERLDFLYDSGLAVGKGSSSSAGGSGVAFKALEEAVPNNSKAIDSSSSTAKQSSAPGALFEDKPHSANDTWRKLHSDPLLLIRQREQEALARIKNNPVKMALIRKSVEANKGEKALHKKERGKKHSHKHLSSKEQSDSEDAHGETEKRRKTGKHKHSKHDDHYYKGQVVLDDKFSERESQRRKNSYKASNSRKQSPSSFSSSKIAQSDGQDAVNKSRDKLSGEHHSLKGQTEPDFDRKEREKRSFTYRNEREKRSFNEPRSHDSSMSIRHDSRHKRHNVASKLSEEERAAKLREMQMDAELHEEQRWKRLRKAEEDDVWEATHASMSSGKNFLDAAQRSVYGTEKGGSSTIEESVRRRKYYSQGRSEEGDGNSFRR
ncbi:pre-mRNA-splicing factor CWC25 homolog [Manihot esculenta]|uniref:CBF1-interacting co-repressor CIR N-terminal domain-containing protein n=1 Tax=Manihot esculenta TaxID=3983 RepID=A0A251L8N0_MANES|nr:pre-mRNA-splicing factor CWC25 homolog [Manihot esculenta]XP_021607396.1 pre-mRNA-splicing factor CWC25 homolog [Manihot esculenta]XP_021607397.1 pre-mRNA-splicing factor CWC25 homolog [Manihot esculenta]XP_043810785.1 pre-mRNA-splicing factor CWC25 homolog [Manihot esculenta]OAY54697.1 hypothetical protein MANES_03G095600v8 [Manihot esculenta]OAY54698.1 hypothetical protein MANES_03G095600v8 [Manihot esculenta]OAY54699.1 hypothetical protein MANES_03G095600v8 [Manihot esculenta]OAY54700.